MGGKEGGPTLSGGWEGIALLAFLALDRPGEFVGLDRLAEVFRPHGDPGGASGELTRGVDELRRELGDGVVERSGDGAVRLRPGAFWCDALVCRRLLDGERLEEALHLYRGEILDGFELEGHTPFHAWLEGRRDDLRRSCAAAAWRLADGARAHGSRRLAVFWAKRALNLSPFDEDHVVRLVELLDDVGDRAGALRAYEELRTHLRTEHRSEPSPGTRGLVARLRAQERPVSPNPPGHQPGRRSGMDRRQGDRRVRARPRSGPERRSGVDRRRGERRSGRDRRGL